MLLKRIAAALSPQKAQEIGVRAIVPNFVPNEPSSISLSF